MESLFSFQMRLSHHALIMMRRGVLIDEKYRRYLVGELTKAMHARTAIIEQFLGRTLGRNEHGHPTLFRSTKQMAELFALVGAKPGTNRKTGKDAYDDQTLFALAKKKPKLAPLCYAIMEFRTLGQMLSTFVMAKTDPDGRMRANFNTAGPITFRLASAKNNFGRATNLQNVTTGDRSLTGTSLPNLRKAIIPAPGSILAEPDLAGADARVVAWDSGSAAMKDVFRGGYKIHAVNCKLIYGEDKCGKDGRNEPYYTLTKSGVHATNYYAKPKTVANSLGISVAEAVAFQQRYFGAYPEIPLWHERVKDQLYTEKRVCNAFGYCITFFDRIDDGMVDDALAWIGQSTVACVANRAWDIIELEVPEFNVVLQEHDSLVGEPELYVWNRVRPLVKKAFERVIVPYSDPLIIPPELKVSTKNWGEMEKTTW